MWRAVVAARARAVGMGHMERVGPELQYDLSKPLGSHRRSHYPVHGSLYFT
jgi:hypothetical protein